MAGCKKEPVDVLVVAGPTATGKSNVAIELARRLSGEIICADSMQVYKELSIGTAAPTAEQLQSVPHHLYSILDPADRYSVARYIVDASAAARDIAARGKLPILCGGTGQYIDAFSAGLGFSKALPDTVLRTQLEERYDHEGGEALLREIKAAEPQTAAALHPNDRKRIVRALELLHTAGHSIAVQNERSREKAGEFRCAVAVLHCAERASLYRRIEQRVDAMMAAGLLDEAQDVYASRDRYITAAQAIGYKEFFSYFEEQATLEQCVEALKQATRRYAKRQITWFKRNHCAMWYDIDDGISGSVADKIEIDFKRKRCEQNAGGQT